MTDKTVSTNRLAWIKSALWAVTMVGVVALCTFLVIRARTSYALQRDVLLLRADIAEHKQQMESIRRELGARLDEVESFLFGDVLSKLHQQEKVPPRTPEPWQANTIRDVRSRLQRLEQRMLEQESRR